jgi:hypothetical protein
MLRLCFRALMVSISAFALHSAPAAAADRDLCRDYAQTALRQVHDGLSAPACRAGLKGDRWSSDYRVHFNWCLRAAIPKVESERGAREGYLFGCGGLRF